MSDREYCKDCKYCVAIKKTFYESDPPIKTTYYMCDYPVPDWALPKSIVHPDHARTCSVQELKISSN